MKSNLTIALLISFLVLILLYYIPGIILFDPLDILGKIPAEYRIYVLFFSKVVFPFCGAYVVFRLCYSGKLYKKIRGSALFVPALIAIVAIMTLLAYIGFMEIACCLESSPLTRAIDAARSELNGRENYRWAQVKTSGRQFQTDTEIDREIVTGTTGGGWNTDLGPDYTWTEPLAASGGTISFQSSEGVALTRKAATLNSPATWY